MCQACAAKKPRARHHSGRNVKLALRSLLIAAFLGSLYWIRSNPKEIEPYVSTVLAVAALLGTFYDDNRKMPNIVPHFVGKSVKRFDSWHTDYALVIANDGDFEVRDFTLALDLNDGEKSPIWNSERQPTNAITVPILHAGQRLEWQAHFFIRARTEFSATWGWTGPNRRKVEKTGCLKVEALPRS